jgi:hypothetical protein
MKTLKISILVFISFLQCCKSNSDNTHTQLSKDVINDEIKKEIYDYSDELNKTFGEFPLNLIVDINTQKSDTLIIRFAHITPFYFDLNLVKQNLWFNERLNGVNYYYVTDSAVTKMDTNRVLLLNQDNQNHDIYYYAKELTVINNNIVQKKDIHWTKIKWLQIPPPPNPN